MESHPPARNNESKSKSATAIIPFNKRPVTQSAAFAYPSIYISEVSPANQARREEEQNLKASQRILQLAEKDRQTTIANAEQIRDEIILEGIHQARDSAGKIILKAEAEAKFRSEQILNHATNQQFEIINRALEEAKQIKVKAEEEARKMIGEAKASAAQIKFNAEQQANKKARQITKKAHETSKEVSKTIILKAQAIANRTTHTNPPLMTQPMLLWQATTNQSGATISLSPVPFVPVVSIAPNSIFTPTPSTPTMIVQKNNNASHTL